MNSLGIPKSKIKGPLDCLQPHSYIPIKKQQCNIRLLVNNLLATKDIRRNIGKSLIDVLAMLKKHQNLFFYNYKYVT